MHAFELRVCFSMLCITESWCLRQEIRRLTHVRKTDRADRVKEVTCQYRDTLPFTKEKTIKFGSMCLEQPMRTETFSVPPSRAEVQHCTDAHLHKHKQAFSTRELAIVPQHPCKSIHRCGNPSGSRPRANRREARPAQLDDTAPRRCAGWSSNPGTKHPRAFRVPRVE